MSGRVTTVREELGLLKNEWDELNPTLRFLDIVAIGLIALFGIGYIIVNVLDVSMTVSNGAMLIFPLVLTGYIYVLRSKIANEEEDNSAALREFMILSGITLFLVVLTFVYSFIIQSTL
ncbi:MAG: hypothetical protein ACXAE3_14015 [Candidatus Kariarchaeaceae archaeon]